ncbi:MAG: hypothetical protein B6I32_02995 [Desulfobacterium sp. 4572_20]|nr:MAG: hypothetical protein B6I32_02995 [Desulfobacterium sp. 4572_20]
MSALYQFKILRNWRFLVGILAIGSGFVVKIVLGHKGIDFPRNYGFLFCLHLFLLEFRNLSISWGSSLKNATYHLKEHGYVFFCYMPLIGGLSVPP